jgi:hypothetical protein
MGASPQKKLCGEAGLPCDLLCGKNVFDSHVCMAAVCEAAAGFPYRAESKTL